MSREGILLLQKQAEPAFGGIASCRWREDEPWWFRYAFDFSDEAAFSNDKTASVIIYDVIGDDGSFDWGACAPLTRWLDNICTACFSFTSIIRNIFIFWNEYSPESEA